MPTILDKWNEIKPYMFGRKTHGESSTGQTEIWSGHANGLMVEVLSNSSLHNSCNLHHQIDL